MSIKTLRKRIALVAVSALGVGVLTSVAANAAAAAPGASAMSFKTAAVGDATSGVCANNSTNNDGSTVAKARVIAVGGSHVITVAKDASSSNNLEGQARISGEGSFTATAYTTVGSTFKTATITGANNTDVTLQVNVTGTGLISVTTYSSSTSTTAIQTLYINGVASCTSGVSASKSYVQVVDDSAKILTLSQWNAGTASSSGTTNAAGVMDTSNDEKTTYDNADTAYIGINTNDAYGNTVTSSKTIIVSCTNNAVVGGNKGGFYTVADTAAFKQISVAQATANTAMTTVCSVSSDSVLLATKTIKFLGQLASITLTNRTSGNYDSSTAGTVTYRLKDAAGNSLPQVATPILTASTASKITNAITGTVTAYGEIATGTQTATGRFTYNCLDYGDTEISVYYLNSVGAVVTSNTLKVHCGGDFYNFTASLDKASYKTGDIATLTIVGKDYAGGLVGSDETLGTGLAVALAGMTAVVAPSTADTASDLNGTWTYQYQVGTTTGDYTGTVKVVVPSTSNQYNKAVTMQYKIVASETGVSNAEVLAAIVKLIASINKQIRALQKSLKR